MAIKRVVLYFPQGLIDKPIIYHLVKDYGLVINILRANVDPDEAGRMVLELRGSSSNISQGVKFLKKLKIQIEYLAKEISVDSASCIDCGACTAVCPQDALEIGEPDWKLKFKKDKCILCGLCVPACPVGAIKIKI